MTIAPNAGLHDFRFLFAEVRPRFGMPAGESEEEQQEQSPAEPDSTSAPASEDEHTTGQEGVGDEDEDGAIRNPRIKALSDENKRHRLAAKQERERADGLQERVSTLMLENAFIKASAGRISDFDAALKLMDRTGITITPEGEVTGIDEALAKVIERYPYVADEDGPADTDLNTTLAGLQPSGRPANGKRSAGPAGANNKVLRDKFPALRRLR